MQEKKLFGFLMTLFIVTLLVSCIPQNDNKEITYIITQYGDYEDQQHMFYTIVD